MEQRELIQQNVDDAIDLMAKVGLFSVFRSGATDRTGIFKDINGQLTVDGVLDMFEKKLKDDDPQARGMFWNDNDNILKVKELIKNNAYRDVLKAYWEVRGEDEWNVAKHKVCSVQEHLHQVGFPTQAFKNAMFNRLIMSN